MPKSLPPFMSKGKKPPAVSPVDSAIGNLTTPSMDPEEAGEIEPTAPAPGAMPPRSAKPPAKPGKPFSKNAKPGKTAKPPFIKKR